MWSKGHRDSQHFIRRGNATQGKVNLNKRYKILHHIWNICLLTSKGSSREWEIRNYLTNVYIRCCSGSCKNTLVSSCTFGCVAGKVCMEPELTRFANMEWCFFPWTIFTLAHHYLGPTAFDIPCKDKSDFRVNPATAVERWKESHLWITCGAPPSIMKSSMSEPASFCTATWREANYRCDRARLK